MVLFLILYKYLYRDVSRLLCLWYNTAHCAGQEFTLIVDNLNNTAQWKNRRSGKHRGRYTDNILKHRFCSGTGNWSFPNLKCRALFLFKLLFKNWVPMRRKCKQWEKEKYLLLENKPGKQIRIQPEALSLPGIHGPLFSHLQSNPHAV
jgi:hypothetical protein